MAGVVKVRGVGFLEGGWRTSDQRIGVRAVSVDEDEDEDEDDGDEDGVA